MSPGRALLKVKEKLKNYRRQDGGGSSIGAGSLSSDPRVEARGSYTAHGEQPVSKGVRMHSEPNENGARGQDGYGRGADSTRELHKSDTNVEIAEIDSRLQALQEFLKSAKQSSGQ
jgi:hypothetical protein